MAKNKEILSEGIIYFEQIRKLLAEFKVRSSPVKYFNENVRKDGSQSVSLHFDIEKSSFRNFLKYVGFNHTEKQQKLLFALSTCGQAAKISSKILD